MTAVTHLPSRMLCSRAARRLIAWCLLAALPLYGASATLVELLGPLHGHREVAASPMAGWHDFRRAAHVSDGLPHAHAHGWFARHHHADTDDSVVAVDGGTGDVASSEAAASVGMPLIARLEGTGSTMRRADESSSLSWPAMEPHAIPTRESDRLERPPRV